MTARVWYVSVYRRDKDKCLLLNKKSRKPVLTLWSHLKFLKLEISNDITPREKRSVLRVHPDSLVKASIMVSENDFQRV